MDKLRFIMGKIGDLVRSRIQFVNYRDEELYELNNITSCSTLATCGDYAYCELEKGICALRIPNKHLISGHDNKFVYLGRIADELIRYNNIRDYLLSYSTLLGLGRKSYDLDKSEIVISESVLFTTYFDNVVLKPNNPYVHYNTYDTAAPSVVQVTYDNVVRGSRPAPIVERACQTTTKELVHTEIWYKYLPRGSKKLETTGESDCTNHLVLSVFNNFMEEQLTANGLKEVLAAIYSQQAKFRSTIVTTLRLQGKRELMNKIGVNEATLETVVMSDDYYFTNLDIIELAKKFQVPIFMISPHKLKENGEDCFTINYKQNNTFYYIIKQRAIYANVPQKYEIILTPDNGLRFDYAILPTDLQKKISENALGAYHLHKRRLTRREP
jgi:hypothetical protein